MAGKERRSILVIDDTPEDIAILNEELKTDFRVLAATDRDAAIRILGSKPLPDLILLDVMMPGVDGYELCRELKAWRSTRDIPVIFVTVKDAVENEAAGFEAGGVDYIAKPVNPFLVKARVKSHIELKLAREELQRRNEMLLDNIRLREEVEAINRHDMKNPLTIILSVPRLLLADSNLTENQRELLRMAQEAGRRMLEMINSSIDVYKMEMGTYRLKPAAVDVLESIRNIRAAFGELMAEKEVACEVSTRGAAAHAGPFLAKGEDLLVYTMLSNLIKNAIEASPRGGQIAISLDDEEFAVISIHNEGAIPQGIRGRYFQKYATAGKEGGTGLGAYSAKLIATTLGGRIDYTTSEERGTTVTVRLPPA